jgi:hypothetical protein
MTDIRETLGLRKLIKAAGPMSVLLPRSGKSFRHWRERYFNPRAVNVL